jgi:hypothetical protein
LTAADSPDLSTYKVNPLELGFIPPRRWKSEQTSLATLIDKFFRARSSKILRFEQKLWNALTLTSRDPGLYSQIGVKWVAEDVIKVHRDIFGRFLNVTRPAAALYNNQGSFMTHGFVEVPRRALGGIDEAELSEVDESVVRLFRHQTDSFTRNANETKVMTCTYTRGE